ncbi:hypothetical protein HYY75_08380 [bacterium]|nr:hypothetical protein [bacterium]
MLLVDDQLAGDLGKFVGIQAINFTLKRAHDELRKAYPFTMYMEKVQVENGSDGKRMFIFSGRGKGAS